MKKNVRNLIPYIFLFLLFFLCLQVFFGGFRGDYVYHYGFSYALRLGEIPYLDFNMIVPPFSAYLYAFFFFLFGTSNIVLNLTQSFLLCVFFFFCFQLFDKKAYFLIPILCFPYPLPFPTILFPGYNFLLLLELVILLYCEKTKRNDYGIGVILGLSILTKQTVGFTFLLVSLYYLFVDSKKFWKRLVGFMIPCLIFFLYLLFTNSLMNFLDLCVYGMFEFSKKNGRMFDYNFLLFLFGVGYLIAKIFDNKKEITNYYLLAFSIIAIPLFDYAHVTLFLFSFFFLILPKIPISYSKKSIGIHSMILATAISVIWFGFYYEWNPHFTNFPRFSYFTMTKKNEKGIRKINQYIQNHKEENLIFLNSNAYLFKIMNQKEINHYDLINYGNNGYQGTDKIIQKIKEEKDPVFIIHQKEYESDSYDRQQINKEIIEYVMDHYSKVESIEDYIILKES